jgi:hypothetical protein
MTDQPTQQNGQTNGHGNQRVEIKVPEIYKQVDESVWQELETFLYTGFLVSPAAISGKSFVFKTLNHYELRNIQLMRSMTGLHEERAFFRACFIAYSIFMIDAQNAIYQRPRHINRLIKTISKLPAKVQDEIVSNLTALNEKSQLLMPLVEAYVHENRSRYRWFQLRDNPIHHPISTGIPGTEELGMNVCQQTWIALNNIIDRNEEMERDWQNAKFIGSCFAGKGVRAIEEKDKIRRERERTDREDLKMKVLYTYLNRKVGKDVDETEEPAPVKLPDGRMAHVAKRFRAETAEELAQQLSAALSGELDYHDLVINSKLAQVQQQRDEREQFQKSLMARASVFQTAGASGGGARILGGKAEADAYVARMKQLQWEQIQKASREHRPDRQNSNDPEK